MPPQNEINIPHHRKYWENIFLEIEYLLLVEWSYGVLVYALWMLVFGKDCLFILVDCNYTTKQEIKWLGLYERMIHHPWRQSVTHFGFEKN